MNYLEIKKAIEQGLTVCLEKSTQLVALEKVCPLHDLSVICAGKMRPLSPLEFDDCFIKGA